MRHHKVLAGGWLAAGVLLCACGLACDAPGPSMSAPQPGEFDADLAFLREHTRVIVLSDSAGAARVVVAPEYQGRVMTSTIGGPRAPSFGWIGRAAVAAGQKQPHINVFGGEDRFWLGPEGGQYSLYFRSGDPFDLEHWQVPEAIDWGGWDVVQQSETAVAFRRQMTLTNYSGTQFRIQVDRTVRLLGSDAMAAHLGAPAGDAVRVVAFESENTVMNIGDRPWQPDSGLVSVWILGMFQPSPETTIVIPFVQGPDAELGPIVNDRYFGKVPEDRLVVGDGAIFFRGDGDYRSKIGLSPRRATSTAGSYNASSRVITIVQYNQPEGVRPYVNSMWEIQSDPYSGDAINSYNDGPPGPGEPPLGPFYELETSSPALHLPPSGHYTHVHRTFHLTGPEAVLDRIARATLHVSLEDIARAFARTTKARAQESTTKARRHEAD